MVDATTLIVISTIVQTIVISITLIIFTLQFRSQEKAIRESSYQGLLGRYNDSISTLAEKPDLAGLMFGQLREGGEEVSAEDAAVFTHLLMSFGIIEEAYLLYKKEWIDEVSWQQWSNWLKTLTRLPQFVLMTEVSRGTFDPDFEDYVRSIMAKDAAAKPGTPGNSAEK